jgi:hypothetical protein
MPVYLLENCYLRNLTNSVAQHKTTAKFWNKAIVSKELTGVKSGINRQILLLRAVTRAIFTDLFGRHLLKLHFLTYNTEKFDFFVLNWQVSIEFHL